MCHSTTLMCHCEERSDVAISGRQLRFRRWLSRDSTGYGEIATAPLGPRNDKFGGIAPLNLCRNIASLQGGHYPQGARRIRKAAKPPTAAQ